MATDDRLIESAQELLWERGYVGTSPNAIQRRAGVGQGSMYHHFAGKRELAAAALRRSADDLRVEVDAQLASADGALEQVAAYLGRERDVLRGCRIGGMTQDPDVIADPALRGPLDETFTWLQQRLAGVLADGQSRGELVASMNPQTTATAIVAALQGGYVLARAADSTAPFDRAIDGVLALLATQTST